jgi:hypothetical protein
MTRIYTFNPLSLILGSAFLISLNVGTAAAQDRGSIVDTRAASPSHTIATVHVPHPFWIEGERLPAGDYTLSRVDDTVVLFRNAKAKAEAQAFLIPSGEAAPAGEHKLVFVGHGGRHYLTELWFADGKMTITSQFKPTRNSTDAQSQIKLVDVQSNRQNDGNDVQLCDSVSPSDICH